MLFRCIIAAIAVLCAWPACAQKTGAQLNTEIGVQFPDNSVGAITPSILRTVTSDIVNSIYPTAPVVANNLACFNGTTGLLKDCASAPTPNAITALTGDGTATGPGSVTLTLTNVNLNVGTFGSATAAPQVTVNAKGLVTGASNVTVTPAVGSITGLGTGIATALGINVGTAGSPVVNGGALGTPSGGTLTNATGLPTTGLTGTLQAAQEPAHTGDCTNSAGSLSLTCLKTNGTSFGALATVTPGTGVATALAVNVGTAGAPVINGGALGTPSSGTLSSATGLPISTGVSGLGTSVATALAQNFNTTSGGICQYQFGTWTPSFTGSGTSGTGQTYSLGPIGSYETCGRLVIAHFSMQASSLGTAAGNLQISGLPFTATTTSNDFGTCSIGQYAVTGLAASNFGVNGIVTPNTQIATLQSHSNTGTTSITIAQAGSTVEMIGECTYRTN